jgi:hypothetical protein
MPADGSAAVLLVGGSFTAIRRACDVNLSSPQVSNQWAATMITSTPHQLRAGGRLTFNHSLLFNSRTVRFSDWRVTMDR